MPCHGMAISVGAGGRVVMPFWPWLKGWVWILDYHAMPLATTLVVPFLPYQKMARGLGGSGNRLMSKVELPDSHLACQSFVVVPRKLGFPWQHKMVGHDHRMATRTSREKEAYIHPLVPCPRHANLLWSYGRMTIDVTRSDIGVSILAWYGLAWQPFWSCHAAVWVGREDKQRCVRQGRSLPFEVAFRHCHAMVVLCHLLLL